MSFDHEKEKLWEYLKGKKVDKKVTQKSFWRRERVLKEKALSKKTFGKENFKIDIFFA